MCYLNCCNYYITCQSFIYIIWSECFTVCSLWAIIITVLPTNKLFRACVTSSLFSLSRAEVGSSNSMMSGFFIMILAIASLCLCHHESLMPFSHISVSSQFGKSYIHSQRESFITWFMFTEESNISKLETESCKVRLSFWFIYIY